MIDFEQNRAIAHLDLDTFFVSVERLQNRALHNIPVIIGGQSSRGVVAGCSYEARQFGVFSAMPMKMARILCPDAVFIRGDMEQYSRYSNIVTEIIAEKAPIYEKASIDEHYLDLTGMDRFFGTQQWLHELRSTIIKESGLPISFGLSVNKTVSKIATGEAKPNGELHITPHNIPAFLGPLSIRKIPMIGQKTYQKLRAMGIITIHTLSLIPPQMMQQVLGKNGIVIWKKANGIDPTPVQPYNERKSLSHEITFEKDTTNLTELHSRLVSMTERLAFDLRSKNQLTACITVKLRYTNFDTHTIQQKIPYTALDHLLIPIVKELFTKLYQRRMLIRLIGVRFSHLVYGNQQINMFDDTPEMTSLYQAMDRMRTRYGQQAVRRAIAFQSPAQKL